MKTLWTILQNAFCVVGVVFVLYYFCVGLFGASPARESFDRHKVSQVTVPPQKPAWEKPQLEYRQMGPVEFHGNPQQQAPFRLPSWDEGFVPYAVWLSGQNPCRPNRPH